MTTKSRSPRILECTLRDGSYSINFQFTAVDTSVICSELEKTGFEMIEVGHGIGLNASKTGNGVAAETDEAYLRAAADVLSKAKFGMFCIPGIARLEDIDMAAEYGMGFIRIGTNVNEAEQAKSYIERAKKHGMFVAANFMKSYATLPADFAQKAKLSQSFGADVLYIVDSAGGMLASDLEDYFHAVRSVCDIPLAFHGHNNLGMAVAHTIRAVELGAIMVDTTLQGIGRSSGNAPTEIVVALLKRMGLDSGIDLLGVMDVGEKYIKPLMKASGLDSLDMIAGYAQFHSSYIGIIREYSIKYRIDPRRLIMGLCEKDRVNAPRDLVDQIARNISTESSNVLTARFRWDKYFGNEQNPDK